ncbi:MAG: cytochrome c3 family protein [Candidatus Deferrimicrobiota bacterium]
MRKSVGSIGVAVLFVGVLFFCGGESFAADACVTRDCHAQMGKAAFVHGPVGVAQCTVCHIEAKKGHPTKKGPDFKLVATGKALCEKCHQPVDKFEFKHTPVKKGECLGCHDPHQSAAPKQLKKVKTSELCYTCHKNTQQVKKYLHGPVATGDCNVCHNPHSSPNPMQLTAKGNDSCFLCHEDRKAEFTRKYPHKPALESCLKCHDAHNSDHPFMLASEGTAQCLGCHKKMADRFQAATVKHTALIKGPCTTCHTPHSSDFPRQMKTHTKDICYICHKDMGAKVRASKKQHGPVQQNDCYACHDPHGSNNPLVLKKYFPSEFYKPYATENYAMCFDCHNKDIALDKITTKLTNFRNGDVNQHFLHVNKEKGRSCKACHEVHAGDQEKHIRKEVPFGKAWMLPVQYTKTANGGTCVVGCHKPKTYDRVNPVKYE